MLIEIHSFSFKKMHVKMTSAKWRPFCLSLNVLMSPENGSFLLCSHYSGSVWYVQGQSGLVFLAPHLSSQISWIPGLTHCGLVMPYSDRFGSTLVQVMAWCLTAPSHYLNQCWLCISQAQPLPEPMLTLHQSGPEIFMPGQFHKRYRSHQVVLVWNLLI